MKALEQLKNSGTAEETNGNKLSAIRYPLSASKLSRFDLREKEPLAKHTSFQIGGPVDFWIEPRSHEELAELLRISREYGQPIYLIGGGNNMLVEDEGLRGIAVHLGNPAFRNMELLERNRIRAGGGTDLSQLLACTAEKGLSGLEFLAGVPGTVGGAVWMNAGRGRPTRHPPPTTYHSKGEVVESVTLMQESGKIKSLAKDEIEFGYRHTNLPTGIVLDAILQLTLGDPDQIRERVRENLKTKIKTQDLYFPSAGCVFKNPSGSKKSSGQLIDETGLKGIRVGQAQISQRHANFIINRSNASARDVLTLVRLAQHKVKEEYGVQLELELKVIRSSRRAHGGVVQ